MGTSAQSNFLNEIKINDDILFHVIDSRNDSKKIDAFDLHKDDLLNDFVLE